MEKRFCAACGTELAPGAAFCGACGARSQPAAPPPAPSGYSTAPAYPPPVAAPADQNAMLAAFVGPNADYYLAAWRRMDAERKASTWNWQAFFISAFWFAYRRMWMLAAVFLAAFTALLAITFARPDLARMVAVLQFVIPGVAGWYGNRLYRDHAAAQVAQISATHGDAQARLAALQAGGGTSMIGALGLLGVWVAICAGLVLYFAEQVRSGRSAGSSVAIVGTR